MLCSRRRLKPRHAAAHAPRSPHQKAQRGRSKLLVHDRMGLRVCGMQWGYVGFGYAQCASTNPLAGECTSCRGNGREWMWRCRCIHTTGESGGTLRRSCFPAMHCALPQNSAVKQHSSQQPSPRSAVTLTASQKDSQRHAEKPVQRTLVGSCLHCHFTSQSFRMLCFSSNATNGCVTLGARSALDSAEEQGAAGGVDGLREPLLLLHAPGRRIVQLLLPPPLVLLHAHAAVTRGRAALSALNATEGMKLTWTHPHVLQAHSSR